MRTEALISDNVQDTINTVVISSRLIVKNLPKYVDEGRLKEHFGSHGEVTDCRVIRTRYVWFGCEQGWW